MNCKSRAVHIPTSRKNSRLAFHRPHSPCNVAPLFALPLEATEASGFKNLAFPPKQKVMREQAKYKCLEFAALQRWGRQNGRRS
jgi:hypothetical protein